MRTLVWVCALVTACRGADHAPKPLSGPRLQLAYETDLDKAVDDRLSDVKRDLETQLADKKIAATVTLNVTGTVTVTPSDPPMRDRIASLLESTYRDTLAPHECAPSAGPGSLCYTLGFTGSVKKAALDRTTNAIRARLLGFGLEAFNVTTKGEQVVVEVPDMAMEQLEAVKSLLTRSGALSFHVVDNDSAFMKQLFARAGTSDATAAGIEADIARWRLDDGTAQTDYYLFAHDRDEAVTPDEAKQLGCLRPESCLVTGRQVIERYVRTLAAQDPSFAVPDDRQLVFEHIVPGRDTKDQRSSWRTYYVERTPALTGSAIANARVDVDAERIGVELDLNRDGAYMFGDVTARIVGKKLATILDGKVVSAPIINGPIRGGHAMITMAQTSDDRARIEAEELALVLRSGALPGPLVLATQTRLQ